MRAQKTVLLLMCALLICVLGTGVAQDDSTMLAYSVQPSTEEDETMQMRLTVDGNEIVFALNQSPAAAALYAQLPLQADISNFSNNEKIFYPPQELDTTDTPLAGGSAGTLAYYAPWGDVVMFFGDFGKSGSLYELGQVVSGGEHVANIPVGTHLLEKEPSVLEHD